MDEEIIKYNDRAIALRDATELKREIKKGTIIKCPGCGYSRVKVYKHCPACDYREEVKEDEIHE